LTTDDRPATDVATSQQVLKISELRTHPGRALVVFGAPIAFIVTGSLHVVAGRDTADMYLALHDHASVWIGIHVIQLALILLLAVAVYYLTEGMTSAAARVSRIALLPYLVFYSTYDSVVGLSTGLVVHYGAGLAPDEQAVLPGVTTVLTGSVDQPIPWVIVFIGSLSWAVAVIAAAVALSRAGASWAATVPLGLAGVIGAIDHALPFGPIAMALFLVAAYVLSRPGHETA